MTTIPQKELRNNISDVLRRAEGGEEFTITVSGRPVAQLSAAGHSPFVPASQLTDLWTLPADPTLAGDLEQFGGELRDPWA